MTALVLAGESPYRRAAGLAEKFATSRRAANTTRAYRLDLIGCRYPLDTCDETKPRHTHRVNAWLMWCGRYGIDPFAATSGDVMVWLADLTAAGEATGSRARRLSAVSAFYRWLVRDGMVERNPADLDPQERPVRRTPGTVGTALSRDQMADLLRRADQDSRRTGAIVATLYFTGIRSEELVTLDVEDLGSDRGHLTMTVHGKGGKVRVSPVVPPLSRRIDTYLTGRIDIGPNLPTRYMTRARRPLFTTVTGRRLDTSYLRRLISRLSDTAGLPALTPHDLRRTFATLALDDGVPLRDVQDALGHADPRTTRGYDRAGMNPDRHPAYRLAAITVS